MIAFIKKLLEKIGVVLFLLVVGAIALSSLLLGVLSAAEIVVKIATVFS